MLPYVSFQNISYVSFLKAWSGKYWLFYENLQRLMSKLQATLNGVCYRAKPRSETRCRIRHKSNELDERLYAAQTEWSEWLYSTVTEPTDPGMTDTRNRAWKPSGTQGKKKKSYKADRKPRMQNFCHSESGTNFKTHKAGNTSNCGLKIACSNYT